jgi:hypothetical protein
MSGADATGEDPSVQTRSDLLRFKELMESGTDLRDGS